MGGNPAAPGGGIGKFGGGTKPPGGGGGNAWAPGGMFGRGGGGKPATEGAQGACDVAKGGGGGKGRPRAPGAIVVANVNSLLFFNL